MQRVTKSGQWALEVSIPAVVETALDSQASGDIWHPAKTTAHSAHKGVLDVSAKVDFDVRNKEGSRREQSQEIVQSEEGSPPVTCKNKGPRTNRKGVPSLRLSLTSLRTRRGLGEGWETHHSQKP